MKLFLPLVILILLQFFISCKKKIFRSKLTGTVRHFYTRLPISGIPVKLSHGSGGWLYGHQGSDGTVATDGMGTFFFKIREERNSAYSVSVDHLTSLDSMQNEWNFVEKDRRTYPLFDRTRQTNKAIAARQPATEKIK